MSEAPESAGMVLLDIADAGAAVLARPLVADIEERREAIARLRARLDAAKGAAGERYLNYFAPLLLHALDRALYFRRFNDAAMAEKFDGLVGHLVAHVRADASAAFAAMRE